MSGILQLGRREGHEAAGRGSAAHEEASAAPAEHQLNANETTAGTMNVSAC